jgi:PilZ domain
MTLVILPRPRSALKLARAAFHGCRGNSLFFMSDSKSTPETADWSHLMADPDLVRHLGKLLQTYRDAPPERREEALLEAMRDIKKNSKGSVKSRTEGAPEAAASAASSPKESQSLGSASSAPKLDAVPAVAPAISPPPFEPDIFTPSWGQDRRRYPRLKCFVAVELHLKGSPTPIWGNLSNTSIGGCFVESVTPISPGVEVEIGLWVASGKIWVKGLVLNGVVTKSAPSFGIRVKFSDMEPTARESLREFLRFVESTTKGYERDHGYLAQLKR